MRHSVLYTLVFSALLCIVCAVLVSSSAVSLKERQDANKALDRKLNVLQAAGLVAAGEKVPAADAERMFASIETAFVDLVSGEEVAGSDPEHYDQQQAKRDPELGRDAPSNPSSIKRLPKRALVYKLIGADGNLETIVLPIEGYGLWGTLFGFLALEADASTVVGLTYYEHKETPGLGGEVDNPRWKKLWPGRKLLADDGERDFRVIKGNAGPASADPHRIDGLSGATITSRGVSNMIHFWMGPDGFGPYLEKLRATTRRAA